MLQAERGRTGPVGSGGGAFTGKSEQGGGLAIQPLFNPDVDLELRTHINAPAMWKIRNAILNRLAWMKIGTWAAKGLTQLWGFPVIMSNLRIKKFDGRTGLVTDYGIVSRRVITTVFAQDMVDELITETSTWGDYKFHDSGVGVTAAAIGDTDIETTDAVARTSGTQVEASATVYRSVGTITYGSTLAITEHGLFNALTGGTLMDRHVFSAINVVSSDSIQFTYELTVATGG